MLQSQIFISSAYDDCLLTSKELPKLNNAQKALIILDSVPDLADQRRSFKQITAVRSILKYNKGLLLPQVIDKLLGFLERMAATNTSSVQKHVLYAVQELMSQVPIMRQASEN